jgi:hypothetical protein
MNEDTKTRGDRVTTFTFVGDAIGKIRVGLIYCLVSGCGRDGPCCEGVARSTLKHG